MKSSRSKTRKSAVPVTGAAVPSPIIQSRGITQFRQVLLAVGAGGICEFDGCGEYLFEHRLTLRVGNFAELAHIVAFRENGPRGLEGVRPLDINSVDNLMLLCPACHKLIDDNPTHYSRQTLEAYKRSHEARIRHLTALGADRKTSVIVLKARIAGHTVSVPFDQIVEAIAPRYPITRNPLTIDLTPLAATGTAYYEVACETIRQRVEEAFRPEGEAARTGHVSAFAIGPMSLLAFFGRQLTNKVPVDVFQRHRDTENWTWKTDGPRVSFRTRRHPGGEREKVALVFSLSGRIDLGRLPDRTRDEFSIYEMTLDGQVASTTFLRTRDNLEVFRLAYQELIAVVSADHGRLEEVDVFPAVPAPVAVLLGRELLPKVHPKLRFFDQDQATGWTYQMTV
jgi:hypothetical protein